MAETVITIKVSYENGGDFKMTSIGGDGPAPLIVCHIQENSNITIAWPNVEKICESYFAEVLKKAGDEMKKPTP